MGKKRAVISGLLGISMAVLAAAACADDGGYIGASYVGMTYKEDGIPDAKPASAAVRLGRTLNKNISVEARIGEGVKDDSVPVFGIPVTVKVESFFGVFLRAALPITQQFSAYGLVGYTQGKVSASASGFKLSTTDSDTSYGVGADFAVSKNVVINAEAAKYFSGEGYKVTGIGLGLAFYY